MQNPLSDLTGKAFLITGASSGIGAATARALGRIGARVALLARREEMLAGLAAEIRAAGGEALVVAADVSNESEVAAAVEATVKAFGRLDGAFNNAGQLGAVAPLADMSVADFDQVMQTNVRGMFIALKHEMAAMKAHGGSIVNTASIVGHVAFPNFSPYNASKHAVLGLTRTAALEGWPHGIRVNAVSPGPIETPMAAIGFGSLDNLHATLKTMPVGRPGTPDEVAGPVMFLLSNAASYINGHSLLIDGGMTAA